MSLLSKNKQYHKEIHQKFDVVVENSLKSTKEEIELSLEDIVDDNLNINSGESRRATFGGSLNSNYIL